MPLEVRSHRTSDFEAPDELRDEWIRVEEAMTKLLFIPRFLTFNARQISRLENSSHAGNLPGVVLSSLCENIRRSMIYQSALYFGGRNLYPTQLEGVKEIRIRQMVRWFEPMELITILLVIYFHRYLQMRSSADTWSLLNPLLRRDLALGRRVGLAWPAITPGRGMMVAALRRIGQGFILLANRKNDTPKRLLKLGLAKEQYLSRQQEIELCGYTHTTVAAFIAQQCGLGVPLTATLALPKSHQISLERQGELSWFEARRIIEELKMGLPSAQIAKVSPLVEAEERRALDDYYQKICQNKDVFPWINSEKEDIFLVADHSIV